jgi:hypothetical protein
MKNTGLPGSKKKFLVMVLTACAAFALVSSGCASTVSSTPSAAAAGEEVDAGPYLFSNQSTGSSNRYSVSTPSTETGRPLTQEEWSGVADGIAGIIGAAQGNPYAVGALQRSQEKLAGLRSEEQARQAQRDAENLAGLLVWTLNSRKYRFHEFDITVTYRDANKNEQSFTKTYVATAQSTSDGRADVYDEMVKEVADRLGITDKSVKRNGKIEILNHREGKAEFPFSVAGVFGEDTRPCSYQFDVTVQYEKEKATKTSAPVTDTFTRVYTSKLRTLAGAALDTQLQIWEDAKKLGHKNTPFPNIQFNRAVRIPAE